MQKITLSDLQVRRIIELYSQKLKDVEIANIVGTTQWAVRKTLSGQRRPNNICKPFPNDIVFIENSSYPRSLLRKKIISNNFIEYKCAICSNDGYWNNQILTLQVDHINGTGTDHRLSNLRFLCYNCHSQTSTWGAKNIKHTPKDKTIYIPPLYEDYNPRVSFKQKKNTIWKLSKRELKRVVKKSTTFAEILRYFHFPEKGAQYQALKERLYWEGIDFSHIRLGWGINRGQKQPRVPKYSLDEVLTINSFFSNGNLKIRLFKDGLLKNMCLLCGLLPEWNELPLTLQLDHINGICNDNRIENLRILCPNCHSQTSTYAGRNI